MNPRRWWERIREIGSTAVPEDPSGQQRERRRFRGHRRQPHHPAFTPDAVHRAWRRVRANGGGAGVDGVSIAAFEKDLENQLESLRQELATSTYRPRAVRRVFVPKPNEGLRPLAIWALRDRVAQRAMYDYLEPFFEPEFLGCSHGFRPGRSVDTAVHAVLSARDVGLRWVLDTDIKDCFDSIDAKQLVKQVKHRVKDRTILRLLDQWLSADILDARGRHTAAGAAQGGVLSPLLCNIYLHPFDVAMTRRGVHLVRYADDLVCLCRRKREAQQAHRLAQQSLSPLKLELHPQKTRIVHFDQGFKFLGVFFVRNEHFYLS